LLTVVRRAGKDVCVLVPLVIFIVCVGAGVAASARWLPELATGRVGGMAFFVVCGLLGAAVGLVGLRVFSIVEEMDSFRMAARAEVLAGGLGTMLWEVGSVLGIASVVYLLAPGTEDGEAPVSDSSV
jgi:hypothetical protein